MADHFVNDLGACSSHGPYPSYARAVNAAMAIVRREAPPRLLSRELASGKSVHRILCEQLLHVTRRPQFPVAK